MRPHRRDAVDAPHESPRAFRDGVVPTQAKKKKGAVEEEPEEEEPRRLLTRKLLLMRLVVGLLVIC